jgi:mannosyl-oligosaccharide alpha-1,2-mannosidase
MNDISLICGTQGWKIFKAFEAHCQLDDGGFASIRDVDELPVHHEDRMETFWIVSVSPSILMRQMHADVDVTCLFTSQSETLKYLLLLFSNPDVIPLDKYVFNTEAHPLPVFTPTVVHS